jgi:predicted PurR-regulated permease PerM
VTGEPSRRSPPPAQLVDAAGWVWRAVILVAGGWVLLEAARRLYLITLPFAAGILLAALAYPMVAFLCRRGTPRPLAVLAAALAGLVLAGGIGVWVVYQTITQGSSLVSSAEDALSDLPISNRQLNAIRDSVTGALRQQAEHLAGPALTGLVTVGEFAAGVIIAVFVGLYLLANGEAVWRWVVSLVPRRQRPGVERMGPAMWHAVGGWIRGTAVVAVFHGTVIGTTLLIMRVPLAAPLGALVFLGSFIPIVGAFVFGGFAVVVTFASHGLVSAVILLGVLVGLNQFEAHVLQPFLIGRYVHLNALAVVAALTAGSLLWGVAGAILAVPLTAAVHAGLKARRQLRTAPAVPSTSGEACGEGEGRTGRGRQRPDGQRCGKGGSR